jgi:hypothetical protein
MKGNQSNNQGGNKGNINASQNVNQNYQNPNNKHRPEIRDNLDHRENLELHDESGHNAKDVKSAKKTTEDNDD